MLIFTIFVPKVKDRVIGGFTIDVTAQARIESWQNALEIAKDHPFLGIGFNNFRFAQSDYGFFNYPQTGNEHSGAGSDSSFLTILATSGILGFVIFIASLTVVLYKSFLLRKNFLAFATFVSFISIIIHSQFVNSLLFPLIMIWLWFLAGLAFLESKDEENSS
jgi:O-antigen ligase